MITKVVIKGFRLLKNVTVNLQPGRNIVVGNNAAGKSTFLQAIHLALSGQLDGRSLLNSPLSPDLFNAEIVGSFCKAVENKQHGIAPPQILIELYFSLSDDVAKLRGKNNSLKEDVPGVSFTIRLNDDFAEDYAAHLQKGRIHAVPVEFYSVDWRSFADSGLFAKKIPVRSRLIDATHISGERDANQYVLDVVDEHLGSSQRADLSLDYRTMKHEFLNKPAVLIINEALKQKSSTVSDRRLSLSLDTTTTGTWEKAVVTRLDDVPFPMIGRGEQVSLKVRLALAAASAADVLLVEEPENHLTHTNMSRLIDRLSTDAKERQIIITTHSSFVINKLGLRDIILFSPDKQTSLTALSEETQDYFRKLPGHDSLRLILCRKAILVEGPSDELIIQRAYLEKHGKPPLADGVEVITVRGLAFKRFLAVAKLVAADVTVVTDNDGDVEVGKKRVAGFENVAKLCMSMNPDLPSLEYHLAADNDLATLNAILGARTTKKEHQEWMSKPDNKTETALLFFDTSLPVILPAYVKDAVI